MTTYNTMNPVPSADARDRYDNSQVFDEYVTGESLTTPDRLGVSRRTMRGQDAMFADALAKIGFESTYLIYTPGVPGVTILRPTQLVFRSGVYYRITDPSAVPLVLTGTWATDEPLLTDVGDASLRTALAAVGGASLVNFSVGTVQSKLAQIWSVDDFKTGSLTDIQAIEAMLSATGGTARLLPDRVYNLHNWTYSVTTGAVNIRGAGKPSSDLGYTALSEKGASVISGHIDIRAPVVNISDFGVDCGTARGYAHGTGCLTVDAPNGAIGVSFTSRNIAIMGADTTAASVSHGFLIEGFDRNTIDNTDCFKLWYGIILKGRRGFVRNTRAWMISGTPIFIKSDVPASGGNVLDATVSNVTVDGLISETYNANTTCNGVYVMASTAVLATVKVMNISQTFGNTAVTVAGGGASLYCAGVEVSNVKAIGTYIGVETFGTTYDVKMTGIVAENPKTGMVIKTSGASSKWKVGEWSALLTEPALSSVLYLATFGGTGSWDSCDCRSGVGTKLIPFLPDTVICGKKSGQVIIEGEGPLSFGGNWSGDAGDPPSLTIHAGNLMKLSGRFINNVATGTSMAAVAGGVRAGTNPDFICAGFAAGSTPNAVLIRWSAAGLTLMSPALGSFGPGSIVSVDQMILQR